MADVSDKGCGGKIGGFEWQAECMGKQNVDQTQILNLVLTNKVTIKYVIFRFVKARGET